MKEIYQDHGQKSVAFELTPYCLYVFNVNRNIRKAKVLVRNVIFKVKKTKIL
jgi:hypothetical protein